jgi:hypothetical protein
MNKPAPAPELKILEEQLSAELGAPVNISQSGESGKITISFYSEEELKHLLMKLAELHPSGEEL